MQVNKQSEKTGKTRTLTIIGILTLTIMTAIVGVMIGRNLPHPRSATSPTAPPETSSPPPLPRQDTRQRPYAQTEPKPPTAPASTPQPSNGFPTSYPTRATSTAPTPTPSAPHTSSPMTPGTPPQTLQPPTPPFARASTKPPNSSVAPPPHRTLKKAKVTSFPSCPDNPTQPSPSTTSPPKV